MNNHKKGIILLSKIISKIEPEINFLDIGFGFGGDSLFMAKKGFKVTAIDRSKAMVEKLNQKIKEDNISGLKVICGDITDFKIVKNKYSVINAKNVFQFLNKKIAIEIISNLKNKLKDNGYILISCFTVKDPLFKDSKNKYNCYFKPKELKNIFIDWKIIYYQEKTINDKPHYGYNRPHKHHIVQLIAQKCQT